MIQSILNYHKGEDDTFVKSLSGEVNSKVSNEEFFDMARNISDIWNKHFMFNKHKNNVQVVGLPTLNISKVGKIIVVGCGGTGSWLIPRLVKTINDLERKGMLTDTFEFVLVDGDTVNCFSIGRV